MDDQKTQDNDNQNLPVNIPINDIAPPPPDDSVSQKINVVSGSEDEAEVTEDSVEVTEITSEPKDEPLEDPVQGNEQLSPVTAPPDEINTEKVDEPQPVEEPVNSNEAPKQDKFTSATSAPAEMGVASSQMNAQKHPHRNNKKLATIVTIMTALLLAGTAVYVYMSANKNTNADNNSDNAQTNESSLVAEEEVQPATAEDVNQTITEVEESLSALDDEADFNEENLSNETLGL